MRLRRMTVLLRHRSMFLNILRLSWLCIIIWLEIGVFIWTLRSCAWPDSVWSRSHLKTGKPTPAHLLVVADTQVLDDHSLPSVSTHLRPIVKFLVDSSLRKSWNAVRRLHPDGILFLGDMINGGRYARDPLEYDIFARRFYQIFSVDPNVPTYYVVGNHDVGLGRSLSFSSRARSRFRTSFNNAQSNSLVQFGNHTLVLLDSPGLVEEDYKRVGEGKLYPSYENIEALRAGRDKSKAPKLWEAINNGTVDFIQRIGEQRAQEQTNLPLILFSHIPLARPEHADCGPYREGIAERAHIRKGAGPGYQNLLGKATSSYLLETLKPNGVFSADDHDYCEFMHSFMASSAPSISTDADITKKADTEVSLKTVMKVKETTVKTFSTVSGIRRPGFQLLSLWNPLLSDIDSLEPTFMDRPCLLPDQERIYIWGYLPLLITSFALIVWVNLKADSSGHTKAWLTKRDDEFSYSDISMTKYDDHNSSIHRSPRHSGILGVSELTSRPSRLSAGHLQPPPSPSPYTPTSPTAASPPVLISAPASPSAKEDPSEGDYFILSSDDRQGVMTPGTANSIWAVAETPRSPLFERSGGGKSDAGGWRRSGTRGIYGLNLRALGEMDREKEKRMEREERAQFIISSGITSNSIRPKWWDVSAPETRERPSLFAAIRGIPWKIKHLLLMATTTIQDIVLGRPVNGGLGKRVLWDVMLLFIPVVLAFTIVTWWIMR